MLMTVCLVPASPQNSPKSVRSSLPLEIPNILNRRNSASSVEHTGSSDTEAGTAAIKAGLLSVDTGGGGGSLGSGGMVGAGVIGGQMPRTRSSTSLQDLIKQNAAPTLSVGLDRGKVRGRGYCWVLCPSICPVGL
jgi:hypothetical protein